MLVVMLLVEEEVVVSYQFEKSSPSRIQCLLKCVLVDAAAANETRKGSGRKYEKKQVSPKVISTL